MSGRRGMKLVTRRILLFFSLQIYEERVDHRTLDHRSLLSFAQVFVTKRDKANQTHWSKPSSNRGWWEY